jgi:hypothetical protein
MQLWMFVHELFFSLSILSFAALLCLFGAVMLIDGLIRLTAEWYNPPVPTPGSNRERVEKPTGKLAA